MYICADEGVEVARESKKDTRYLFEGAVFLRAAR